MLNKILDFLANRRSSKTPACNKNRSKYIRPIYAGRLLNELYKGKCIVNIDESGFSKNVKTSCSWLPTGHSASIINEVFAWETNLILAIKQTGY